jgi:hypothetical protein
MSIVATGNRLEVRLVELLASERTVWSVAEIEAVFCDEDECRQAEAPSLREISAALKGLCARGYVHTITPSLVIASRRALHARGTVDDDGELTLSTEELAGAGVVEDESAGRLIGGAELDCTGRL